VKNKQLREGCKEKSLLEPILEKKLTIASGATPSGALVAHPTKFQFQRIIKAKENLFIDVTPIGREFLLVKSWTTPRFSVLKQSNKAETIARYDARVASSRQDSNAMIEIDREGKTLGSVLCGLVYAPGCALLVIFRVYHVKKILVDALGTLRTTGTLSL
jgi:hypothetical protein